MVAERFRRRDHAAINVLWIGVQFQEAALLTILVPAIVLQLAPNVHTFALAALSTLGAATAALVPPFAGALSDRARRSGGDRRRQTAILLGVDAAALIVTASVNTLPALGVALVIGVGAMNAAATIYQVLVPEIVPRHAWGTAAGFRGAMTLLGTIFGLIVAAILAPRIALLCTAGLVTASAMTLLLVPAVHGQPPAAADAPKVRSRRDLAITLVSRAWIVLGMALLNTYVLYFFTDVLGVHEASFSTGLVGAAALVGAIVSSVWAGVASDRAADKRRIVALSGIPMIAAAIGFALVPNLHVIFVFAALFGLGYGGVFSVGWALALDAVPELGDVGRDLGIWYTLSGLPSVVAPALGAVIIAAGATPRLGYQWLFITSGICFAIGSATVLRVGRRPVGTLAGMAMLAVICTTRLPYWSLRMRVRQWGRLPRRRGPTVLVANHQHEDESEIVVERTLLQGPWRAPVCTVSSRRMWEPGFMASRMPVSAPLTRRLNVGPIFQQLGLQPVENQLSSRPLASLAREVRRAHGDRALAEVFRPEATAPLPDWARRLSDVERAACFAPAQTMTKLAYLHEPYRSEAIAALRARVDADVEHIVDLMGRGATFFVTPEGSYSPDGRLHRLKGILERLLPLGELWFAAIAFDPFRSGRLSMLYRVVRPHDPGDIPTSLAAARPVTASAMLAHVIGEHPEGGSRDALAEAVRVLRAGLPPVLFVDPEFDAAPERAVADALKTLVAGGALAEGTHARIGPFVSPHFPLVEDLVAYQAAFFAETRAAGERLTAEPVHT